MNSDGSIQGLYTLVNDCIDLDPSALWTTVKKQTTHALDFSTYTLAGENLLSTIVPHFRLPSICAEVLININPALRTAFDVAAGFAAPLLGALTFTSLAAHAPALGLLFPTASIAGLVGSSLATFAYTLCRKLGSEEITAKNAVACAFTSAALMCIPATQALAGAKALVGEFLLYNATVSTLSTSIDSALQRRGMTAEEFAKQWAVSMALGMGTGVAFEALKKVDWSRAKAAFEEALSASKKGSRAGLEPVPVGGPHSLGHTNAQAEVPAHSPFLLASSDEKGVRYTSESATHYIGAGEGVIVHRVPLTKRLGAHNGINLRDTYTFPKDFVGGVSDLHGQFHFTGQPGADLELSIFPLLGHPWPTRFQLQRATDGPTVIDVYSGYHTDFHGDTHLHVFLDRNGTLLREGIPEEDRILTEFMYITSKIGRKPTLTVEHYVDGKVTATRWDHDGKFTRIIVEKISGSRNMDDGLLHSWETTFPVIGSYAGPGPIRIARAPTGKGWTLTLPSERTLLVGEVSGYHHLLNSNGLGYGYNDLTGSLDDGRAFKISTEDRAHPVYSFTIT